MNSYTRILRVLRDNQQYDLSCVNIQHDLEHPRNTDKPFVIIGQRTIKDYLLFLQSKRMVEHYICNGPRWKITQFGLNYLEVFLADN